MADGAAMIEQQYEYKGKLMTLEQLAKIAIVSNDVLRKRLRDGWEVEKALFTRHANLDMRTKKTNVSVWSKLSLSKALPSRCKHKHIFVQSGGGFSD